MKAELLKLAERLRERKCVCTPQNSTSVICVAHGTPWAVSQHIADELTALLERQGSGDELQKASDELREKARWLLKLADSTEVPENDLDDAIVACSAAVDAYDAASEFWTRQAAQPPSDNAQKAAEFLMLHVPPNEGQSFCRCGFDLSDDTLGRHGWAAHVAAEARRQR